MDSIDATTKYLTLTISTPAHTASKTTAFDLSSQGEKILDALEILFAPGHAALTGVRVSYNGVVILPWNQNSAFILGNDERLIFDVGIYVAKPLSIVTTNTDAFPHVHVLTAKLSEVPTGDTLQPFVAPAIVRG